MTSCQSEMWNFVLMFRRCEKTVSTEMPRRAAICFAFSPDALSIRIRCSASVSFGSGASVPYDAGEVSQDSGGAFNTAAIASGKSSAIVVLSNIVVMPACVASAWYSSGSYEVMPMTAVVGEARRSNCAICGPVTPFKAMSSNRMSVCCKPCRHSCSARVGKVVDQRSSFMPFRWSSRLSISMM